MTCIPACLGTNARRLPVGEIASVAPTVGPASIQVPQVSVSPSTSQRARHTTVPVASLDSITATARGPVAVNVTMRCPGSAASSDRTEPSGATRTIR